MTINLKSFFGRPISKTILFYIIAYLTILLLSELAPSGPCVPGIGILGLILLPFVSAVLFLRKFIKRYKGQKEFGLSAITHFIFILGFDIYIKTI
jgi:hypothetical protein